MTVEYVDAGEAINQGELSGKTAGGEIAPPVTQDVDYERIKNARSEPENWLTYYGAYDGQRYSPLDQINTENVKRIGEGVQQRLLASTVASCHRLRESQAVHVPVSRMDI